MGRTKRHRAKREPHSDMPNPSIHHDLYSFLSSHGWNNPNRLTVSSFKNTGRGLYAKRDLFEHDLIIELPLRLMITYLTVESDCEFYKLFSTDKLENVKSKVSFQSLLALYLQHQKLKGESSEWIFYLNSLPKNFNTPYFCKKSEMYHLPQNVLENIVEQNVKIKNNYCALLAMMKPDSAEYYTLETFKWAYFACNSRSVYLDFNVLKPLINNNITKFLSDSPNLALAPLLDLLNHSSETTTNSQLTHSQGFVAQNADKITKGEVQLCYQLYSLKRIKKFTQVFINYGTYNNTKLLLEYGFVSPDNQMDFLEFSLGDVQNYVKNHHELKTLMIPKHKYKFIRDHNLDQQMFIDASDGLNHNFQAVLSILLIPQNVHNLTQITFGDELKFDNIRIYAIEILEMKKMEFEKHNDELQKQTEPSGSGIACQKYLKESVKLINKVLNFFHIS